ncbi:MAG: transcriptional repressor [Gammaproteobacteria bacterium]|nr:transcriptional repressor [Gammaproteobacteria bacterium]
MTEPIDAHERLRSAGLRVTRARLGVLETLAALGGHRTTEDVARGLKERGITVSRASIFNVLADLTAAELVMVADAGPGSTRYEIATEWHHHLVCRNCGSIIDVPCAKGTKPCMTPDEGVGVVDEAQVIYRGMCSSCLALGSDPPLSGEASAR